MKRSEMIESIVYNCLSWDGLNTRSYQDLKHEHNFPIDKPAGCVIVNDMKMICNGNVTIVSVE